MAESQTVVTLVKPAKELHILLKSDAVPAGCAVSVLNEEVTALLLVKVNFARACKQNSLRACLLCRLSNVCLILLGLCQFWG